MGSLTVLPIKHVTADIFVPFDFISHLSPGETISGAVVTAAITTGTDPTPSAILSGGVVVQGTVVLQKVVDGLVGVIYLLVCTATTTLGNVFLMQGQLAITDSDPYH